MESWKRRTEVQSEDGESRRDRWVPSRTAGWQEAEELQLQASNVDEKLEQARGRNECREDGDSQTTDPEQLALRRGSSSRNKPR
jgi:hypothetical protein